MNLTITDYRIMYEAANSMYREARRHLRTAVAKHGNDDESTVLLRRLVNYHERNLENARRAYYSFEG